MELMKDVTLMHQDLVIVRCGAGSKHMPWLGAERQYDLILFAYEKMPKALLVGADEVILVPGQKVVCWQKLFAERPEFLTRYRQVALLDDDLTGSTQDINRLFEFGRANGLALWQPSLTWDSYFSYAITLHNPAFQIRYVNFVEMMCAFFSAEHLRRVLPVFSLGYELNVDRLWCRLRPDWQKSYAIIDAVQFRHTRAVGLQAQAHGFRMDLPKKDGSVYQSMIDLAEHEMGVFFHGPVAYAGVTAGGVQVTSRLAMALRSMVPLLGARQRRNHRFFRPVSDHVRHILTRPVENEPLDLAAVTARIAHARGAAGVARAG